MAEETSIDRIDEVLSTILGLHGPWVLAVECYDDEGESELNVFRNGPNIWTSMGLIEAARESTLERFRD